MKLKIYVVDLEIPARTKRRALLVGIPLVVLLGAAALGYAGVPNTFKTGDALSSQKLNDNFTYLAARVEGTAPCPVGYTQQGAGPPVVCTKGMDQVVQVGTGPSAFWIDEFEAVLIDNANSTPVADPSMLGANFPQNGQWTGPAAYHAESRTGVQPTVNITWFQANTACRAAGKRLPIGSEWLEAARGTPDDGTASDGGKCNTSTGIAWATGNGTACASEWGAQDMIGNVWEWTDEWYAGLAPSATVAFDATAAPWPALGYKGDGTWNIASSAYGDGLGTITPGIPAAGVRGGIYEGYALDGVFALRLDYAPSYWNVFLGFRCVLPH